jgi:hypothetical protein
MNYVFAMSNLSYSIKRRLLENFKNVEILWHESICNKKK